jgi:hypothetical protein
MNGENVGGRPKREDIVPPFKKIVVLAFKFYLTKSINISGTSARKKEGPWTRKTWGASS